jgi:hypothetical protein
MTLHAEISKAVEAWLLKHGKNRCTMNNGKGDLVKLYLKHNPLKTEEQAKSAISDAVLKERGIIQPQIPQKGRITRSFGAPTSKSSEVMKQYNKTNNPLNNPINSKKRSELLHQIREATIAANVENEEENWSPEVLSNKADKLMATYFGDLNLQSNESVVVGVFVGGAGGPKSLQDAVNFESMQSATYRGDGIPSVLKEDGERVGSLNDLKSRVALMTKKPKLVSCYMAFDGTNSENVDRLEKEIQTRLMNILPREQRMFKYAGMGSCESKSVPAGTPFPYYLGILIIKCSLQAAGLRLGTKDDLDKHLKKRKNKSSPDTTSTPAKQKKKQRTLDGFFLKNACLYLMVSSNIKSLI